MLLYVETDLKEFLSIELVSLSLGFMIKQKIIVTKNRKGMKKKILDALKNALDKLANVNNDLSLQPVPVRVNNRFGRNF